MNLNQLKALFFQNTQLSQIVFKNTSWMVVANIIAKAFKFGMMIVVARELGPGLFGEFNYIIVLSAMCFMLSDVGLSLVIVRDYQINSTNKKELISTGFYLKLLLVTINTGFAIACMMVIDSGLAIPFAVFSVMNIIDSIKSYNITITRAHLKQEIESTCFIIETVITSVVGGILAWLLKSVIGVSVAYLVGSTVSFIYIFYKTKALLFPVQPFNRPMFKYLVKKTLPFSISAFFIMALNSVDTLMIEWLIDVNHVGYYHSGLKLIDTILIIPALFGASIFPFVSKFHHSSDRLKKMAEESLGIMGLIGIPITCCGILLAPNILTFVYSTAYAPGSLAFTILLGSVFPTFIIYILNNFLLATNHEKICVKNTGVGFSINILINTALIPILGINGAAIGTLLSRLTLLGLAIYHAKKQLSFHGIDLKKIGVYLFFSGILFGSLVALQYVINHVLLLILIGTALYGLMLIASNDPYAKKIVTLFKKNAPHNQ